MTLGKSSSNFKQGDKIFVLIPYQIINDQIVSGTLETSDAKSGGLVESYELVISTDPRFADMTIPEELEGKTFMVGIISVNEGYLSKVINISTTINGAKTSSSDAVTNAFGVNE